MKKKVLPGLLLIFSLLSTHCLRAQTDFPPCSDSTLLVSDSLYFIQNARAGRMDSAIYYARQIEKISLKQYGEMSHSCAVVYSYYLGYTYLFKGDATMAYSCLKKGVEIFEKTQDVNTLKYGDAAFHFAVVSYDYMAWEDAEKYFKVAMLFYCPGTPSEKFFPASTHYTYAQTLLLLASSYCNQGNYQMAISLNMTLNEMIDTMRHDQFMNYLRGAMYNNMGVIYSQTGNPAKSLQYLKKALPTEAIAREEGFSHSDYVEVLLNLAEGYIDCGQADSALQKCQEAADSLSGTAKTAYPLLYAKLLKEKASIYQHMNKLPEAIVLMRQYCASIDTLPGKPADHESNLINLGSLYANTGQYGSADSLFRKEIRHLREAGLNYSYEMQQATANLCEELITRQKYEEASDSLVNLIHLTLDIMKRNFAGMSENDQLQYKNELSNIFDLLYTSLYNRKTVNREILAATARLEMQRENLILINQTRFLQKARASEDSSFVNMYRAWLNCRQMLAGQYARPYDQRQFSVDSLEEVSELLEKRLSVSGYANGVTDLAGSGAQGIKPGAGSADIAFLRFHDRASSKPGDNTRYAAFVYTPGDSLPAFVNLCSETALARLLRGGGKGREEENQVTQKIYNSNSPGAIQLYRFLWQPIEPFLHGIRTIRYSTAGLMNNIAFPAVYTGRAYLHERYTLRRYLNLQEAEPSAAMNKLPGSINLWGNMDYNKVADTGVLSPADPEAVSISSQDLRSIASTKGAFKGPLETLPSAEMEGLKKTFTAHHLSYKDYEGEHATEDRFKQQSAQMKGVLHISTHGFYAPFEKEKEKNADPGSFMAGIVNPLFRCGLAFSGVNYYWQKGKARDHREDGMLTGFEIAQLDLHQVQLVVLSACETGLGDVTDDEGNMGLQRAFRLAGAGKLLVSLWQVPARQTGELLSLFYTGWLEGKTMSNALQSAQYTLSRKGYPPYYWAGFVLIE